MTETRERLARIIFTAQGAALDCEDTWDGVKALAASQPWHKKSLDFIYTTADAILSAFPELATPTAQQGQATIRNEALHAADSIIRARQAWEASPPDYRSKEANAAYKAFEDACVVNGNVVALALLAANTGTNGAAPSATPKPSLQEVGDEHYFPLAEAETVECDHDYTATGHATLGGMKRRSICNKCGHEWTEATPKPGEMSEREWALVNVSRIAAKIFRVYAKTHAEKSPPQGEKALRNIEFADMLDDALAAYPSPTPPLGQEPGR